MYEEYPTQMSKRAKWTGAVLFAVVLACILMLSGCCTCKKATLPTTASNDSVRIETKWERIVEIDTVFINIPAQSVMVETRDTISILETAFAVSEARVLPYGGLSHWLRNKDGAMPVQTPKEIIYRDSIIYRDKEIIKTETVEVERKQTLREQAQIWGFRFISPIFALLLLWLFRKPLLGLVRKIF